MAGKLDGKVCIITGGEPGDRERDGERVRSGGGTGGDN